MHSNGRLQLGAVSPKWSKAGFVQYQLPTMSKAWQQQDHCLTPGGKGEVAAGVHHVLRVKHPWAPGRRAAIVHRAARNYYFGANLALGKNLFLPYDKSVVKTK